MNSLQVRLQPRRFAHYPHPETVLSLLRCLGYRVIKRLTLDPDCKAHPGQLLAWVRALPVRPPKQRLLNLAPISVLTHTWRKP